MSAEDLRIEALERRIQHLERRLVRLEAAEVRGTTPAATPPPAVPPPPPVLAARPPAAPTARGAIPGWNAVPRPVAPTPAASPAWGKARAWTEPPTAAAHHAPAPAPSTPAEASTTGAVKVELPAETGGLLPGTSLRDLEERFAGRALAIAGGLAVVLASVFFLSYAFSRGWIDEPMRVLIGLAVGMVMFTAGGLFLARRNALMGNVITAVGLGVFSIALFAATSLYGLGDVQAYLIARGEKAGERIAATGIYQQLDTNAERLGVRTGRIVITVAGLIYNFTSWHFEREGATVGNFSIRVDEATDFPEAARFTTQGFIQYASTRIVGRPMRATSERPLPSRIYFHVNDVV